MDTLVMLTGIVIMWAIMGLACVVLVVARRQKVKQAPRKPAPRPPQPRRQTPGTTPGTGSSSSKGQGDGSVSSPKSMDDFKEHGGNPAPQLKKGVVYTVNATYYGVDKAHGLGVPDSIFEHTPAGGYTPADLKQIANYYCAVDTPYLRAGFMGQIIQVTGSKGSAEFAVVDVLPSRDKGVHLDVYSQAAWEMLGGDPALGLQTVKFQWLRPASIKPRNYQPPP